MPITQKKCPHCGSSESKIVLAVASTEYDTYAKLIEVTFSSSVNYRTCGGCGLVFREQMFSQQEASLLYASAYRSHILQGMSADDYFDTIINIPPNESELDAKIANIALLVDGLNILKVIDIGCGIGAFLYKLHAAIPKLTCYGIEPTTEFAVVAGRHNNTTVTNNYDGFSLESYDLVTVVHVLEHMLAPWDFLKTISHNMKIGGYLYLETEVSPINSLPRVTYN